jgi:hypothetical protein
MGGYVPLFSSIVTGTLYGKWPDVGLWCLVLALSDKGGIVDVTNEYLAGVAGLPVADVEACMSRFCAPDPRSRSREAEGARLELIDPIRAWGWRIVNHSLYRERARKQAYDVTRTASGADAQRKRTNRMRPTPTCPDASRDGPLSDANTERGARAGALEQRARAARTRTEIEATALQKLRERRAAVGIPDFREPTPAESAELYRAAQEFEIRLREGKPKPRFPKEASA